MYVITAHQRYRQTDGRTDVKRSHDRYIAKACSGKNVTQMFCFLFCVTTSKTFFSMLIHFNQDCARRTGHHSNTLQSRRVADVKLF